jgi:hypothetical protein
LTLRLDGQILTNIVEDLDALPANERHPPGTKTAAGGGQSTNTIAVLTNGPFRFEVTVEPSSPQTETGNTNWLVVRVNEQPLMMIARNAPNKSMFGQADIQGSPVDGAGGGSPVDETPLTAAAPNIEGMEGRIANGDEAVFRFNVVRGIVTTTAFLVPDDGAKQLFGGHFANQFYVAQVTLCNPNQQPILVYGNTLRLIVRMTAANPTQLGDDGYPTRVDWWATYQPMDYKAVLLMLQRSTARDWRSWLAKGLDLGTKVAGFGTLYTTSLDAAKGIAFFSGTVEPAIKDLLLEDLKKNEDNFQKVGLNEFEEIQPGASLTKYLFLPKGPIFGDYSYDHAGASQMALSAKDADSTFGKKILRPTFIYNIRREEAYVEGKRILSSDPLSSVGTK